jgi:hypothetical protein
MCLIFADQPFQARALQAQGNFPLLIVNPIESSTAGGIPSPAAAPILFRLTYLPVRSH